MQPVNETAGPSRDDGYAWRRLPLGKTIDNSTKDKTAAHQLLAKIDNPNVTIRLTITGIHQDQAQNVNLILQKTHSQQCLIHYKRQAAIKNCF